MIKLGFPRSSSGKVVKNLLVMQETQVLSLGQDDKGSTSNILYTTKFFVFQKTFFFLNKCGYLGFVHEGLRSLSWFLQLYSAGKNGCWYKQS